MPLIPPLDSHVEDGAEQNRLSYSIYPRPCRRFLISSGVSSSPESVPIICVISFSRTRWMNSSAEEYPANSAHFFALAYNSSSILILFPNITLPPRSSALSLGRSPLANLSLHSSRIIAHTQHSASLNTSRQLAARTRVSGLESEVYCASQSPTTWNKSTALTTSHSRKNRGGNAFKRPRNEGNAGSWKVPESCLATRS